jgi:hypothetical protein
LIQHVTLGRKAATELVHENAVKRYAVGSGVDADRKKRARSKNARPRLECTGGVGHEHQAELAHHRVETLVNTRLERTGYAGRSAWPFGAHDTG